ncbi:MAG: DNA repair protein RadA [Rhodospirillaceae bacterium]|nr:DNA repair protein RadA [Rhodospirillaceae bacterium]|tara:strand:- start:642 stop:2057 length:1416 start_codon:yes stop_codon:yes gene_type:complete
MARTKTRFVCQSCGAIHPRWVGHCDSCDGWNTIIEEALPEIVPLGGKRGAKSSQNGGSAIDFFALDGGSTVAPRQETGMNEFDRVAGGGLVEGSAILIGGDPGIGKSTLLLQVTAALAKKARCIYISGEEAIDQIRLRASRLEVSTEPVELATATNVRNILATLDVEDPPDVVVIDSIQTMYIDGLESAPGTVAQIRASAQELIRLAKRRGFALFLVGHVTKEGAIAGPRVLEHMVDTVLYFEGERGHQFRILRSVKNRFGATDEIGVFEMTDHGLAEVANPSALFLADRQGEVSGAAVFAGIEGSRPMLVEIQALVAPSSFATPRRAVVGWDSARLSMTLAVLEARCGLQFAGNDVYLNVAGGLRISEPAADLAVAAALISSLTGEPMPENMIVFGEIGLSGEIRPVGQADTRLKEAEKLGFEAALTPPKSQKSGRKKTTASLQVNEINNLRGLIGMFGNAKPEVKAVGQ